MNIIETIPMQSKEITEAVKQKREDPHNLSAGDQGMMFGYATDEAGDDSYHPISHLLSSRIVEKLTELRKNGEATWLRPDCKSQITMKYKSC
jgi:S-adenosylmethionine synthetase